MVKYIIGYVFYSFLSMKRKQKQNRKRLLKLIKVYSTLSLKLTLAAIVLVFCFLGIKSTLYTQPSQASFRELDLNKDSKINDLDAENMKMFLNRKDAAGDFNEDGNTDMLDFSILMNNCSSCTIH